MAENLFNNLLTHLEGIFFVPPCMLFEYQNFKDCIKLSVQQNDTFLFSRDKTKELNEHILQIRQKEESFHQALNRYLFEKILFYLEK